MTSLASHIQRHIERYADGELTRAEAQEIEALLKTHEGARNYLRAIEEVRVLPAIALEDAYPSVDFDALEDAIMQSVEENAATQQREHHELLTRWADNELERPEDHQRVFSLLADDPHARQHVDALREVGHFTREYLRIATAEVRSEALQQKCLAPFETDEVSIPATRTENPTSNVTPIKTWLDRFQAPLAALVGVAAATAIILPLSLGALNGQGNPLTSIDEMNVDAGYSGTITHGTRKSAPVIWISDDAEPAPTISKEPIVPVHDDASEDTLEDEDAQP